MEEWMNGRMDNFSALICVRQLADAGDFLLFFSALSICRTMFYGVRQQSNSDYIH
jgi:hypothetical protein